MTRPRPPPSSAPATLARSPAGSSTRGRSSTRPERSRPGTDHPVAPFPIQPRRRQHRSEEQKLMEETWTDLGSAFAFLSNWSRWGDADELGTLNLLTDDYVHRCFSGSVVDGHRVSLSRPLMTQAQIVGNGYMHHMLSSGDEAPAQGFGSTADWFGLGFHGFEYTHIDNPAHIIWDGKLYNGHDAETCTTSRGAQRCAVDVASEGILTRALLVDGPRIKGKDHLAPDDAITARELDTWCAENQLTPQPGDSLVIRFGRDRMDGIDPASLPGMAIDTLRWIKQRDFSLIVSDIISDQTPSVTEECRLPFHVLTIAAMGLWLVDNARRADDALVGEAGR